MGKHVGNKYEEFSVCLNEPYYRPEQSLGFIPRGKKFEAVSLILWLIFGQRWTRMAVWCEMWPRTKSQSFIISTTKTLIFKIFCPFLMISLELMVLTLRIGNFLLRCRSRILNIGIMIISKELNWSVEHDFYFF